MESADPSAPSQYSDLYPEQEGKSLAGGALCVWAVNDRCLACKREINQDSPGHLVVLACKHGYHLDCVRSYLHKDGMECLKCFDESKKKTDKALEFSKPPERDEDNNNNTKENEKLDIEGQYLDLHGDRHLSPFQKSQLLGTVNPKKVFKSKIDLELLIENEKNLDDLHAIGLDLLNIYFDLEVKTWSELRRLGLNHEHLFLTQG